VLSTCSTVAFIAVSAHRFLQHFGRDGHGRSVRARHLTPVRVAVGGMITTVPGGLTSRSFAGEFVAVSVCRRRSYTPLAAVRIFQIHVDVIGGALRASKANTRGVTSLDVPSSTSNNPN